MKYGKICGLCGHLYKNGRVPEYCVQCGHKLIYKHSDKIQLTVYEPTAVPVTYHRTWYGKLIITPQENWAKNFQKATKNG